MTKVKEFKTEKGTFLAYFVPSDITNIKQSLNNIISYDSEIDGDNNIILVENDYEYIGLISEINTNQELSAKIVNYILIDDNDNSIDEMLKLNYISIHTRFEINKIINQENLLTENPFENYMNLTQEKYDNGLINQLEYEHVKDNFDSFQEDISEYLLIKLK